MPITYVFFSVILNGSWYTYFQWYSILWVWSVCAARAKYISNTRTHSGECKKSHPHTRNVIHHEVHFFFRCCRLLLLLLLLLLIFLCALALLYTRPINITNVNKCLCDRNNAHSPYIRADRLALPNWLTVQYELTGLRIGAHRQPM